MSLIPKMTKLSPFYQEIIALLQSKVRERPDGAQIEVDLAHLAQAENGALDPSVFAKMMDSYQASQEHSVQVESEWMRAFSEKEFASLGLRNYFPRIYRGLPRLYHRDNPCRSKIKKNFTDLARLKNSSIDRAVLSLYGDFVPKVGTKVGILSWVLSDGLGDWIAAQEAGRILSERFPGLDVYLFVITQRAEMPPANFPTKIIRYEGDETTCDLAVEFGMDFVLQIPTYFPKSEQLLENVAHECVGEYGFLESSWFHPNSPHRSMGLHTLEKGIFIRKHQAVSFVEIEKKSLLQSLFGTEMPGPVEVELYLQKTRFHLSYLSTMMGGSIYLHSLLKMWERDEKNIDVCSPDIGWLIQWFESRQKDGLALLEESFGVREIVIEWQGQVHRAQVGEKGKVLRILSPGSISFSDMQKLIGLSGDWVGVRGNQSLSEAISAGKAFFYDGRDHSRYLMKDILALAENRIAGHKSAIHAFRMIGQAFLWNLPEDLELWVDDTHFQQEEKMGWFAIAKELGTCMQDADAIVGFKKFGLICAEERSFGPFLCNLVQRSLMHLQYPSAKLREEVLRKQYGKGEISFSDLIINLRKECGSYSTQSVSI